MADHVYKSIEVTGTSAESIEDAVGRAIARSAGTLHNLRWFEVTEIRGGIEGSGVSRWQVTVKVGFTLDE